MRSVKSEQSVESVKSPKKIIEERLPSFGKKTDKELKKKVEKVSTADSLDDDPMMGGMKFDRSALEAEIQEMDELDEKEKVEKLEKMELVFNQK